LDGQKGRSQEHFKIITNSFVNNFNDGAASVNEYTQLHNEYICRAAVLKFQLK